VLVELVIAASLLFSPAQKVLDDGFYLTVDCALRSGNKRKNMLDERKAVCLSQLPFVAASEIEGVSTIVRSQVMNYFDVFITPKAVAQFNAIRTAMKNATIALVVDNKVLFIISPQDDIEQTLRIVVFSETQDIYRVRTKILDQVAKAKK